MIQLLLKLILLNDRDGAMHAGHNAVMLINDKGEGMLFSYYPQDTSKALGVDAEVRIAVLSKNGTQNFFKTGKIAMAAGSDGEIIHTENYDRFLEYDVSNENGQNMYATAAAIYEDPGRYRLFGNQCDDQTKKILTAGGIKYEVKNMPNLSFVNAVKNNPNNKTWSVSK